MSGAMLRLRDVRPTSTEVFRSGMVVGRPGDGNGSGLSCASYHAGSIHSSATQLKAAPDIGPVEVADGD